MTQEMMRRLTTTCLITFVASAVLASGRDDRPIAFGAVDDRAATIELVISAETSPNVEVSRSLYRDSELVLQEIVPAATTSPSKGPIEVSLQFDGIADVPDGEYMAIIEARVPSGDGAVGFVTSHALRVTVANGEIRPEPADAEPTPEDEAGSASLAATSPRSLNETEDSVDAQVAVELLAAMPNLRNEGITHTAYCGTSSLCSVVFYNRICNRGTSTAWSFAVGMKGWGTPTISTCTGLWRATNTSSSLGANSCRSILVYGPGYVGPKVAKGSYLTVTGRADNYCQVSESSETDNSRTQTIRVGY